MILVRKRTQRLLAFGKRDFSFLSVSDLPLSDGTWVSGTVSVETPDVPRESGYTRGFQDSIAFYKPVTSPETGQEECHVTIICRIDLNDSTANGNGGFVPMWLYVKTVGVTGLKSVLKMSAALVEMKEEMEAGLIDKETPSVEGAPTSQSVTSPPTLAPVTSQQQSSVNSTKRATVAATVGQATSTQPWHVAPGGAFVGVLATPQQGVLLFEESSAKQQKWKKPLYGIFSHVPSNNKGRSYPTTVDVDHNGPETLGLPFLGKLPFLAKRRRIAPSTSADLI